MKITNGKLLESAKIEYTEICRITVEPNEFDLLCRDISKPRCFYEKYAHQSYANSNGKWNCIVIKCDSSKQKIILYTAGYISSLRWDFFGWHLSP